MSYSLQFSICSHFKSYTQQPKITGSDYSFLVGAPKGANSMAVSGLVFRSELVGTGRAGLFCMIVYFKMAICIVQVHLVWTLKLSKTQF